VLLFRQFVNDDLGCASYLVGDSAAGVAVVVDPPFEIEPVLAAAAEAGAARRSAPAATLQAEMARDDHPLNLICSLSDLEDLLVPIEA